jgi:hypothetical protein
MKRPNVIAAILVVFAVLFYVFWKKTSSPLEPVAIESSKPIVTSPEEKLFDRVKEFPGLTQTNLSSAEKTSECKSALEAIETQSLNTLLYDLNNGKLVLNGTCLFTTKSTTPMLENFPEVCLVRDGEGQISKECTVKLYFYKAIRIHQATLDAELKGLSTEILINKLIGLLAEQAYNSADGLKRLRNTGAELRERLPDSSSATKAALVGYLGDEHLNKTEQQVYDALLNEARHKFPDNWEIFEMDLVRKKSVDENVFKSEVKNYYEQYPNSPIATYHMGCVVWDGNDRAGAVALFETAKKLLPEDKRFADTYAKALTAKPPEKICSVQINFNPEQF